MEYKTNRLLKQTIQQGRSNYHLLRGGWDDPNCAHQTTTTSSWEFREHGDRPNYPAPFFSSR